MRGSCSNPEDSPGCIKILPKRIFSPFPILLRYSYTQYHFFYIGFGNILKEYLDGTENQLDCKFKCMMVATRSIYNEASEYLIIFRNTVCESWLNLNQFSAIKPRRVLGKIQLKDFHQSFNLIN